MVWFLNPIQQSKLPRRHSWGSRKPSLRGNEVLHRLLLQRPPCSSCRPWRRRRRRGERIFDLSRQFVCSLVTLGHSGLGWAQSWQGSSKRRKTCGRFCTILIGTVAALKLCSKRGLYAATLSVKVATGCSQETGKILRSRFRSSRDRRSAEIHHWWSPEAMVTIWPWPRPSMSIERRRCASQIQRYKDSKIQTAYVGSLESPYW